MILPCSPDDAEGVQAKEWLKPEDGKYVGAGALLEGSGWCGRRIKGGAQTGDEEEEEADGHRRCGAREETHERKGDKEMVN